MKKQMNRAFVVAAVVVCGGMRWLAAQAAPMAADAAGVTATVGPDDGRIVVEARGVRPKAPLFFSADVNTTVRLGVDDVTGTAAVRLRIVQGRPEVLSLGLTGEGKVVSVTGAGLRDWAVRDDGKGNRFLDLRPQLPEGADGPGEMELAVTTRVEKPAVPGTLSLMLVTAGEAVGFASRVALAPGSSVDVRVLRADAMVPLGDASPGGAQQFYSTTGGNLEVALAQRGAMPADAEMAGVRLDGALDPTGTSVGFRLLGEARVAKPGARLQILAGNAALDAAAQGEGWRIELARSRDGYAYELVFDRPGSFPVDIGFVAAVRDDGDWRRLDFRVPAGAVVPLALAGLGERVTFDVKAPVVPAKLPDGARGFLPSDGRASLAWKETREAGEGALFFTTHEQGEVRIGAGLLRQTSAIGFRILQGKLTGAKLRIDGPGEILGVEGANVVGWTVQPEGKERVLDVRLSRPFEGTGQLLVRSQLALGGFPVRAEPLRLTPVGTVRHSGHVRIANAGAVRLEVADAAGMMQLAPEQFPGKAPEEGARQVFVYRFPSATYAYRVVADQILPEVGVSQIAIYELAETDRVITADIELDIREAPLREWSLGVPDDYAIVSVTGGDVADYVAESGSRDGVRSLKVLFSKAVEGRQLVQLRLEKNTAAAPGEWRLQPLLFPGAKSVRGHVGVASAPGYRVVPGKLARLVEVPLSYFPKQVPGLQQAFRLREPDWAAAVTIEALGQSVQADVFHLYSLKEGVAYGSVLINYFVVGSPSNEWRIEVPESAGNIDVVGQNVRRDWRREGNQLIVSLHQPVLGAATVLVTFEEPMSARGGMIRPGEVRPLGVQGERGFIQVVSPLQVKHEIRKTEGGLLKLEPLELPAEFQLLSTSPSLAVYQYTARPFDLEMRIDWFEPGETVGQIVDFARLSSRISREGQVVTEARFFVKTRGRKALRMVLPKEMKLWEAKVDGAVVSARADGEQTLVPLPARMDPNEPVAVALRLGQESRRASRPVVIAPTMLVPTVISEWTLAADPGRLLVPKGGNADLTRPALTENGFEWISARGRAGVGVLLALVVAAALMLRGEPGGMRQGFGLVVGAFAVLASCVLAFHGVIDREVNHAVLEYAAPVVPAGETILIRLANVAAWRAMVSWWGVLAGLAGAALLGVALMMIAGGQRKLVWQPALGVLLLGTGVLAQRGGAIPFFLLIAAGVFLVLWIPGVRGWMGGLRDRRASAAAAGVALAGFLAVLAPAPGAFAAEKVVRPAPEPWFVEGAKTADSMVQKWQIRDGRVFGEIEFSVRGVVGDSFLLLQPPAVLTGFEGDGLGVRKADRDGRTLYFAAPGRDGLLSGRATFEMPVADLAAGLPVPTGPAAVQRISIELDEGGWEFTSPAAMRIEPTAGLGPNRSGATLVLGPAGAPRIGLRPKSRDIAAEKSQFFAEVSNLFIPGPGVVNGFHRVTVRPVQGQVTAIELSVPKGFTVGDVGSGPVGTWRFDPEKRVLRVAIEPAQSGEFRIAIETQLGTDALPVDLVLEPLRVAGASGEVGMVALAFGGDAQPENTRPSGLSPVNLEDFDAALVPMGKDGQPLAVVQHVYRYGREGAKVALKVAPVAPEVRTTTKQVLSLGDDRLVLAVDLSVAITRAGLFKLSFELPAGLEVEALSGPALSHWTEADEAGRRVVTMHLSGRTIGNQSFTLALAGPAPAAQDGWVVPRFLLREATRQTGAILLVPEKGIRLRSTGRENVSQIDPREAGGTQPGTLAFRLLQEDWNLTVGIEALDAWVTAQSLEEVTVREGQTLTRISTRYRIENAAVKHLRVRLPGLNDDQARTVRATGPAVSDLVKVEGEADVWEIRFQRGVAGETDVQIEFQGQTAREEGRERIEIPGWPGVRQVTQFVAVRGSGRLELEAGDLPRGWQRVDWAVVPAVLQDRSDRSVPALCFRVAEPEGGLRVLVRRHEVADALKLRVASGELTTLFSPGGPFLTAVELQVEVSEKGTMRVRLPEEAELFNTFVNGESVSVVREGDAYLFHVTPNTDEHRPAAVRLVYLVSKKNRGDITLVGPRFSVPLENVSWRVVVPPGYKLDDYDGGLVLAGEQWGGAFSVEDYQSVMSQKRASETKKAVAMLEQANTLLGQGEQQKAGEMLSRASKTRALDDASNEDARVQLRALKTQQAVLGLNTRRQKLYLDNKAVEDGARRNEQLEQAASLNPLMQGQTRFDPSQMDQLLMGNTVEENSALRGIAGRLVDQQLAAEPAPTAIDVTLPQRGQLLTFTRSLQVDGDAPLTLDLDFDRTGGANGWFVVVLLAALAVAGAIAFPRRSHEP